MERIIYLRLGNGNLHLPKLIGAFLMIAALLMVVKSGADMFESWDNVKYLNNCLGYDQSFLRCQQDAYYAGTFVRPGQENLTAKQAGSMIANPIGDLFVWFAVFLVGLLLYFTGRMVLPVREMVRDFPSRMPLRKGKRR